MPEGSRVTGDKRRNLWHRTSASNSGCTWAAVSVQGHNNHAHCLYVRSTVWVWAGVSNRLFWHGRSFLSIRIPVIWVDLNKNTSGLRCLNERTRSSEGDSGHNLSPIFMFTPRKQTLGSVNYVLERGQFGILLLIAVLTKGLTLFISHRARTRV